MARTLEVAMGACLLLLLVAPGCSDRGSPNAGAEVASPDRAPEFRLENLDGGSVTLSELRGKPVVIDFWATWCPPCEFQVPELNAVFEAHRAAGDIEILGISVDFDGPEVVGAWRDDHEVRYPILLGDEDLARRFGAMGFPTLVIVAPDGSVALRHVGLIERDELERALSEITGAASS